MMWRAGCVAARRLDDHLSQRTEHRIITVYITTNREVFSYLYHSPTLLHVCVYCMGRLRTCVTKPRPYHSVPTLLNQASVVNPLSSLFVQHGDQAPSFLIPCTPSPPLFIPRIKCQDRHVPHLTLQRHDPNEPFGTIAQPHLVS